jgi:6-phosphofructokinase 1
VIGGDGTLRDATNRQRSESARDGPRRHWHSENDRHDVFFVKTFGFGTAVPEARRAIYAANTEAEAAPNGIGLVKLIGRDSGFIAAYSVLVDSQANFSLVPEVEFTSSISIRATSSGACRQTT